MGCTVVLGSACTACSVYFQSHHIAGLDHAFGHMSYMANLSAQQFDGILYLELRVAKGNDTFISFLTTHGSIERSLLREDGSYLTVSQCFHDLCIRGQNSYF